MAKIEAQLSSTTKRNIVLGCLIYFCLTPELNLAIWSYFVRGELGFSQTQAILLTWGATIVAILSEIPTGIFADRFSRKNAVLIGVCLLCVSRVSWVVTGNFWLIGVAQIIGGLGIAFASGAYDAIIHDSISNDMKDGDVKEVERTFSKYLGRKNASYFVARVFLGLLGAWIFTINRYLPYWGAIIILVICGALACGLHEEKNQHYEEKKYLKEALSHVLHKTSIVHLFFIGFNYLIVGDMIYSQIQPYGTMIEAGAITVGILYATQAIFGALTSFFFQNINLKISAAKISIYLSIISIITTLLLLTDTVFAAFIVMVVLGCNGGVMSPMFDNEIMKNSPSRLKATILSISNFVLHVPAIIAAIIGSMMIDQFGTSDTFRFFIIISLLLAPLSIVSYFRFKKKVSITI